MGFLNIETRYFRAGFVVQIYDKLLSLQIYSITSKNDVAYPAKFLLLCTPSQYGLLAECPQRHKKVFGSFTSDVPSAFVTEIVPSTIKGPLGITVTFTFVFSIIYFIILVYKFTLKPKVCMPENGLVALYE
jgi:hypothetical protein